VLAMRKLLLAGAAVALAGSVSSAAASAGGQAVSGGSKPVARVAVVDAEVLDAFVVRRSGGRRVVVVRLRTDEQISAVIRVIRKQSLLAESRVFEIRPGRWRLTLPLSPEITRGPARVIVRLEDRGGSVALYRPPIRVPAPI
jgi:hypothetical protein